MVKKNFTCILFRDVLGVVDEKYYGWRTFSFGLKDEIAKVYSSDIKVLVPEDVFDRLDLSKEVAITIEIPYKIAAEDCADGI